MNSLMQKTILTVLSLGAICVAAKAEVFFNPALTVSSFEQKLDGSTTRESESTVLAPTLGFLFPMGVYAAGSYITSEDQNGDGLTGFGPTVGFFRKGFLASATYHLTAELTSGSTTFEGSGIEVDLGYLAQVTENFYVGPQVKYLSLSFDEVSAGGTATDVDLEINSYEPYVGLLFLF